MSFAKVILAASALVALMVALTGINARADVAPAYEAQRQSQVIDIVAGTHLDGPALMDEATPEELGQVLGLQPGQNGEMVMEDPNAMHAMSALVQIQVDIASQTLNITYPGGEFSTIVSSARAGYHTVRGCFTHPHLELMHYSHKYDNSPMPHSMFFYGGFAIHGTLEEDELGHPASHGCVRVSRADAAYLYGIVEQFGAAQTRICVN